MCSLLVEHFKRNHGLYSLRLLRFVTNFSRELVHYNLAFKHSVVWEIALLHSSRSLHFVTLKLLHPASENNLQERFVLNVCLPLTFSACLIWRNSFATLHLLVGIIWKLTSFSLYELPFILVHIARDDRWIRIQRMMGDWLATYHWYNLLYFDLYMIPWFIYHEM